MAILTEQYETTTQRREYCPEVTPQAELALLARILHREGYDDHIAGHITYRQPDDTLLVNPFEMAWDEIRASDVMRIDLDGNVAEGSWTVTPAIRLHIELHRARDAKVSVHHHPRYATIWAAARRIPPAYDQLSVLAVDDEITLFDDFPGDVTIAEAARQNVAAMADSNYALLGNHGVLVVADDIREAHLRCVALEWRCKQAWHVEAIGGGTPVPDAGARALLKTHDRNGHYPHFLEAAIRREVRLDPAVLE